MPNRFELILLVINLQYHNRQNFVRFRLYASIIYINHLMNFSVCHHNITNITHYHHQKRNPTDAYYSSYTSDFYHQPVILILATMMFCIAQQSYDSIFLNQVSAVPRYLLLHWWCCQSTALHRRHLRSCRRKFFCGLRFCRLCRGSGATLPVSRRRRQRLGNQVHHCACSQLRG
jgi:hypothetical protein